MKDLNSYLFEQEAYRGERTALKFRWILIAVVFVFILITYSRGYKSEAFLSFIPAAVFLLYNLFLYRLIKNGKNLYFLRYFSVSVDIIALSVHILINSRFFSPIAVSTTASIFIYPVLMFLSVLRYDKTLIIYSTGLTLVMFNLNYIIQYHSIDKALIDQVLSSDPMGHLYKSGYLLILGLFYLKIPDMVSRYIQVQKEILDEKNEYVLDLLLEKREKKALKTDLSDLNALHKDLQLKTLEIEKQNQKLSELVQTKDRLISFISHDLKNSFSTMSSIIETARDNLSQLDGAELAEAMDILHKHSLTNHALFENMLQWAKIQRGNIIVNKEKIKLIEFCQKMQILQRSALLAKDISLEILISKNMEILADPVLLTSICNNLIGNAIKFSNRQSKIIIKAEPDDIYANIQIIDQGTGIKKEHLDNIFSIDNCITKAGTEGEKGSGFGLILCKELLERIGGQISIQSMEGLGTQITLVLVRTS